MDKTEQELAEKVGFECDKLGIRHRETGSVIWQANELTGCVDTLWELAISLLQENAKLKESKRCILCFFCGGEIERHDGDRDLQRQKLAEHVTDCPKHPAVKLLRENAEKDARIKELEDLLQMERDRNSGKF